MKHKSKKIIALITCISLLLISTCGFITSKAAAPVYTDSGKKYSYKQFLSDYQFFVKDDLKTSNHFVGAAACGGIANLKSFGNGAVSPSYLNYIKHIDDYSGCYNSHFLSGKPDYQKLLNQPAYYHDKSLFVKCHSITKYPDKNIAYINFSSAFASLKKESQDMAEKRQLTLTEKNLKNARIDNYFGKLLTIPFSSKVTSVYIPESISKQADWILIDGVKDLDELVSTEHIISFEKGKPIALGGSYDFVKSGDKQKAVFISASKGDGKTFYISPDNKPKNAYLLDDAHGLKNLKSASTIQSGQMDLSGVKLIWNFPQTQKLAFEYLAGHVLAPNADIKISGGCFEGGYIVEKISCCAAEGHFYPYGEVPRDQGTPTPATTAPTAKPTIKPTAAPTVKPTVKPTTTPTVKPTTTPTVKPTAAPTVTPTVKPTTAPTIKPTVKPTAAPTIKPTVKPTTAPTVKPTVKPTTAPTVKPTVKPTTTPTVKPTVKPTTAPTSKPSVRPTVAPSASPSVVPPASPSAIVPSATPDATSSTGPAITPSQTPAPTPIPNPSPAPSPSNTPVVPGETNTQTPTVTPSVTPTLPINTPLQTAPTLPLNTPSQTAPPTDTSAPTDTPVPTDTDTPTDTDAPTDTDNPKNTPAPKVKKTSHNNDDTDTYSEEPELPSGQKGSPSTGEKNNSLPFIVTLVLSGAGIIFFGGRAYLISRTKKTDI